MQTPILYTLPIRLFLAYEWLNSGTGKLQNLAANPAWAGGFSAAFGNNAAKNPYPFMADFLRGFAAPNAASIVTFIAVSEVLVGLAFLLGLLVRPASVGAIIMNIFFYLAYGYTSASTAGINLVMIGAQLTTLLVNPGRLLGFDALLKKRLDIPLW